MIFQIVHYFMHHVLRNPPSAIRIFILLGAVLLYGTTGFLYFELSNNPDLNWWDGLWYTVVTMTTVGYGDLFPRTTGGRFLVGWPIMVFGIGLLGYAISVIAAALVTSKTKEIKGMASFRMKNHLIVFNFPGLAKIERILQELFLDSAFGKSLQVVLVDEHLEELPIELMKLNVHFVRGNPVRDETLTRASIEHASHAIILSRDSGDPASDNINVAITLAIEGRNHNVNTVVECIDPASEELLRKAGCDKIVCSSRFDAFFISQELLNPGAQEVIDDLLSVKSGQQIYFTEVTRSSSYDELVNSCRLKGHLAFGLSSSARIQLNVNGKVQVKKGDRIITIGPSRIENL